MTDEYFRINMVKVFRIMGALSVIKNQMHSSILIKTLCLAILSFAIVGDFTPAQATPSIIETSDRWETVRQKVEPKMKSLLKMKGFDAGSPIFVRVFKESSELEIWVKGPAQRFYLFKTYDICKYSGSLGPKLKEGDHQAPEGIYHVDGHSLNPNSRYHLSFDLGFPNAYDQLMGRTGDFLMIHGDCESVGCYAMSDGVIEEIYYLAESALRSSQKLFWVHVFPFRMTDEKMKIYRKSEWSPFWGNLKEAYDYFETYQRPPNVGIAKGSYIFF